MIKLPKLPDFSKFSGRERLLAAGVAFVFCVLMLDHVVLGPWWRHRNEVHQEIRRLESSLRVGRRLLERKPQIMEQMQAYGPYLAEAGGDQKDMAALLREIETMGRESGLSLSEVKPITSPTEGAPQGYAFDVNYTGSLQQWIHFVYLLQSSKTIFQIDRATLGLKEAGSELLSGSLRLTRRAMVVLPLTISRPGSRRPRSASPCHT